MELIDFDYMTDDGGPGREWYDEAADRDMPAPHAMTRQQHAAVTAAPARGRAWQGPVCGGPAVVDTLRESLRFYCGYVEAPATGRWYHE